MKATPLIVAGVAGFTLAGCGTIFEEDLNRVTADVQQWKQENLGTQQAQASGERPSAAQGATASQGETAPTRAADPQLVRNVQKELKSEGIDPGPIDGIWGPKTSKGVREFQKAQGLEETGQLNGRTLSALGVAGGQTAAAGGSRQSQDSSKQSASAGMSKADTAAARAGMATQDTGKNVQLQRSDLSK